MRITGIFEAKQNFSALIDLVAAGEEVRITRHGKELVRMLPIAAKAMPTDAQVQHDVGALQRLREQVKPGPGWRELRDEGRKA